MAVSLVGVTTASAANGGNYTVPKVAGTIDGDKVIAVAYQDGDGTAFSMTGFTVKAPDTANAATQGRLFVLEHDAAADGTTYAVTSSTNSASGVVVFAFRGQDATNAWDVAPTFGTTGATASTAQTAPDITTNGADSIEVCAIGCAVFANSQATTFTPPAGFTEDADFSPAGSTWIAETAAHQVLTSSGAQGVKTFTASRSKPWKSVSFAIKSAGTSTTPVSTTRSMSWNTLAFRSTTRAASWNTNAVVSAVRQAIWNVLAGRSTTRPASWNTLGTAAASRVASWRTLQTVLASRVASWNVAGTLATVSTTRQAIWNTLETKTATRSATWRTLAAVSAARQAIWNTLAGVATTRSVSWVTRSVSAAARVMSWNVASALSQVATTRTMLWHTRETKAATRAASWNTRETKTTSRAARWDVLAARSTTRPTLWDTLAGAAASRVASWNVRELVSTVRSILWRVASDAPLVDLTFLGFDEHQRTVTFDEHQRAIVFENKSGQRTVTYLGGPMELPRGNREFYDPRPSTTPAVAAADWLLSLDHGVTWHAPVRTTSGFPEWMVRGPDCADHPSLETLAITADVRPWVKPVDADEVLARKDAPVIKLV